MDTEQRLKQLTAEFPGTTPPDPAALADVVRRGRRAVLLHRLGVASGIAAVVAAAAMVLPQTLDRPTPPVIAPVVDDRPEPNDIAPEPTPTETHDGGVDEEVLEALPVIQDAPEPSPSAEATTAPSPKPTTPAPAAEPAAQPTSEPKPEPAPEPKPEPAPKPTSEPKPEPSPTSNVSAPFEGFTVAVTTNAREYAEGSEIAMTVRACNTGDGVREQQHSATGHRYDLWIKNADTGDWVADTTSRAYPQAVETVRWEPGQCRTFQEVWHGTFGAVGEPGGTPVPGGNYQVKAKWLGTEGGTHLDYRYSPTFALAGAATSMPFEGFTVSLTTDREVYGYEEKVTFKVRACNTSGESREQAIPHAGHVFDLYVKNADGQVVADTTWRTYSGPESTLTFPAGGCETWLETWWQCEGQVHSEPTGEHLPAGTYTAKIAWLGSEQGQEYGWAQSSPFQLSG